MPQPNTQTQGVVILAAGMGTRMKSATPKVLHPIAGRPMAAHARALGDALDAQRVAVVVPPHPETGAAIAAAVNAAGAGPAAQIVVQDPPLGTGHAVLAARDVFAGFRGRVFVLFGDSPLMTAATLARLGAALDAGAGVGVLGFRPADPGAYGRLVLDGDGGLERIVEAKDASAAERAIALCNAGVVAADADLLFSLLAEVRNDNAKGEYYLTDIVAIARGRGIACAAVDADAEEVMGVNSRAELAEAEAAWQRRARRALMDAGVSMIAPETVWLSWDTRIGRDVTIEPNVVFGPGVVVAESARIRAFSHLEGAQVAAGAVVGPYARLRPGANIGEKARVGNFVEIKNATLGPGAKANHLAYIGDAEIGPRSNIGAGTITCNYDGFDKFKTLVGQDVFVGSNSALVAPVAIGDGAIVGAGSVVSGGDVAAQSLYLERAKPVRREGWAARFRALKTARKLRVD